MAGIAEPFPADLSRCADADAGGQPIGQIS